MFRLIVALSVVCSISAFTLSEDDNRVENGKNGCILEHPYQCSLQVSGAHICGASILNELKVLTAASCFKNLSPADLPNIKVRCGSIKRTSGGELRDAESYVLHDNFYRQTREYDVAVVTLKSKIFYNRKMKPVTLATSPPAEYSACRVSGWGRSAENSEDIYLQTTDVLSLSKRFCSSEFGTSLEDTMICGIGDKKEYTCQGDAGNPVTNYDDNGSLVGVVSLDNSCTEPGKPIVFTSVALVKPWILSQM